MTKTSNKMYGPLVDHFIPQKSRKKPSTKLQKGDGDTWIEKVIFNKKLGEKRSFFRSEMTRLCRWDEPPSGASKIIFRSYRNLCDASVDASFCSDKVIDVPRHSQCL